MAAIAHRHVTNRQGPGDGKPRVKRIHTALGLRRIEIAVQIKEFAIVAECLKTMREAGRNKELLTPLGRQFHRHRLPKSWRGPTQIHRHIQHPASHAPHQFRLRKGRQLEMQPPHRPLLRRKTLIILHKISLHPRRFPLITTPNLRKPTPCIAVSGGVEQKEVGERKLLGDHQQGFSRGCARSGHNTRSPTTFSPALVSTALPEKRK